MTYNFPPYFIPKNLIPVKGVLDTKEKVEKVKQGLEEATKKAFEEFDRVKQRGLIKSKYLVLD